MNICHIGDCRDSMRKLIAQGVKVQTCVTSPPYFGLRDYGHPGQLGLEQTPQEYVSNMVEVFSLVRDLLSDDGTLWLNLGDSYATGTTAGRQQGKRGLGANTQNAQDLVPRIGTPEGLKTKDLIGVPWRVAFALQADGWYLRQDIIWHKPNPMPESVTDRCTKAHEYIFLLSKSERYYFNNEAIKEPETMKPQQRLTLRKENPKAKVHGMPVYRQAEGGTGGGLRNKRSVWEVATQPYSGAHFATFPPALIEPCILAGSRPGDIVLDPFLGSGTTAQVAQNLGRQWLGCELNGSYVGLQRERVKQQGLVFA